MTQTKDGVIGNVEIYLRNPFPELREIFPVINNMILNGNNFKISIEYQEKAKSSNPYFKLEVFRCKRTYPSIIISRFIADVPDLISQIINANLRVGALPFFKLDNSNQFILISFLNPNIQLEKYMVSMPKRKKLMKRKNEGKPLVKFCLTLRKPFSELVFFNSAINSMLAKEYHCTIKLSHLPQSMMENNIACFYIYVDSLDLPSLIFQASTVKDSFEYGLSISKWNWLNFDEHHKLKYIDIKETSDNRVKLTFSCYTDKTENFSIQKQLDMIFGSGN